VFADGGRGELAFAPEGGRVFAYGGYHRLVGFNVADNQAAEAGLGGELRVLHAPPFGDLLVGLAGHGTSYEKNLRYFTFGHGGYFSPQWFVRGTLPVTWRHAGGRFRAELTAAPGAEWFREDPAPVLPLGGSEDTYPGQETSGLAFEARAAIGWRIAGQLEATLDGALQQAPEYFEARAAIVLRWGSPPPARY
jgi:hypothetical protein